MLVITVKSGEAFWIGEDCKITRHGDRLHIEAPKEIKVLRDSIKNKKPKEKKC